MAEFDPKRPSRQAARSREGLIFFQADFLKEPIKVIGAVLTGWSIVGMKPASG
jgi:hypothetical protein